MDTMLNWFANRCKANYCIHIEFLDLECDFALANALLLVPPINTDSNIGAR